MTRSGTRAPRPVPDASRRGLGLLLRRALAVAFDVFAVQLPAAVTGAVVLAAKAQVLQWFGIDLFGGRFERLTLWSVAAFVMTSVLLEAFALARWGRTPGRRLSGVRLERTDGSRPRLTQTLGYCSVRLVPLGLAAVWAPALLALPVALQLYSWWRHGLSVQERLTALRVHAG